MKRFVITQHGIQESDVERVFILEVPDHWNKEDVDALDEDRLETLANEAGIGWNEPVFADLNCDYHDADDAAEELASETLEVVKWSEESK